MNLIDMYESLYYSLKPDEPLSLGEESSYSFTRDSLVHAFDVCISAHRPEKYVILSDKLEEMVDDYLELWLYEIEMDEDGVVTANELAKKFIDYLKFRIRKDNLPFQEFDDRVLLFFIKQEIYLEDF